MTILLLPFPPSVNALFANARGKGKGRFKTKRYQEWLQEAGWALKQQRPQGIKGEYELSLTAARPDKRKRDLDNLFKAISDLLEAHGVVENDADCCAISASWDETGEKVTRGVMVEVSEWET